MAIGNFDVSRVTKAFAEALHCLGQRSFGFPAPLASAIAAGVLVGVALTAPCHAADIGDKSAPLPVIVFVPTAEPLGGERQVLKLLAAGHQAEAEALLEAQIAQFPKMLQLAKLVASKKLPEADQFAAANRNDICAGQRTLFLLAVCARSRFDIAGTSPLFHTVYGTNSGTPTAKCARLVRRLDSDQMKWATPQIVNDAFADFKKLVDENPDDVMIRWMLAVQCRNWNRNAEGAELYRQILDRWNPGPVLVHQTYANLLDELARFEEALVERYKAVKMEPAAWSYDGLGNTLDSLGRYKEANEAHAKAAGLAPASMPIWFHWARGLLGAGKHHEPIEKAKNTTELERQPVVLPMK